MAVVAFTIACLVAPTAGAELFLNEIFWDPPTNPHDATHEYIELRGSPDLTLENHYLVFIEAEDNSTHTGGAGLIEHIFNLGDKALGPTGFLTLRQKPNAAAVFADYTVHPQAADYRNSGAGPGFGSGDGSSIGATSITNVGLSNGQLENGGWTAMIIRNDGDPTTNAPELSFDLDVGNDGLDLSTGRDGWTIIDSIAVLSEGPEAEFGRVYAQMNFMFDVTEFIPDWEPRAHIEPDANYAALIWPELEFEYVSRWGNSTGHAAEDWHIANVTEDVRSGFEAPGGHGDFRISAEPHDNPTPADYESSQGVPYGTPITTTVGSPNYPLNLLTPLPGDFDGDGDVDHDDLVQQWQPRYAPDDLDGEDFLVWQQNLEMPPSLAAATAHSAVPEPSAALVALGLCAVGLRRRGAAR